MDPEKLKQEIKKLSEQLEFLNGEVGRTKGILEKMNIEVQETEVKKAKNQVSFDNDLDQKSKELGRMKKQVEAQSVLLGSISNSIEESTASVIRKEDELRDLQDKIMKAIFASDSQIKRLEEREANAVSFAKDHEMREKEIIAKENDNKKIELILKSKTASLEAELSSIEVDRSGLKRLQLEAKASKDKADETIRIYDGRNLEIDKRETTIKIERETLATQKVEVADDRLRTDNKEKSLKIREEILLSNESDFEKREAASIKRETDVILREAECRVREKALNIANREKQLDEKLNASS